MNRNTAAVLFGLALALPAWAAQDEAAQVQSGPELYYLDHWDVSPPLRDLPPLAPTARARGEANGANVQRLRPFVPAPKGWVDPLEAASQAPAPQVGTTAGLSIEGQTNTAMPPDTNGAVGATQYVQWVNWTFSVYNKSTGALVYGPAAGNTLWSGFGGNCELYNSGDPVVAYDRLANRWVMTQFAFPSYSGPYYQCVAVSTTSDATGTWRRFAYNFTALNDYPKLGTWSDGYYITFNMFTWNGSNFVWQGGRSCALDRLNMITAANTPGAIQCFQNVNWAGLLAADVDGTTAPPAGAPNYQLSLGSSTSLQLFKFKVNWTTPSLSTFTGPTAVAVSSYAGAGPIPQPGTTVQLDSLSDRLMHRVGYRNFGTYESLVVNHSVTAGSAASGVRWYEIRNPNGTPSVYQQGTFSPDATSRWMGSIAQDKQGNMLVGYNASSSSVYAGIRYTGRLATDALGTMQAENTLIAGTRNQTGATRYGDYSSMTVDPADDCTFWFTGEYLNSASPSSPTTRIGSFKFPGCGTTTCINTVPSTSWKGEYFPNKTLTGSPTLVRDDGTGNINFAWGSGGPSTCGIGVDNFSARWTRTINFSAGTWRFSVSNDDGMRLYVDGALKLDKWFDPQVASYTVDVPLTAGNHTVVMEYYEALGGAGATLSWALVGGTTSFTCDDGDSCFTLFGPSQYWHRETLCGGTSVGYSGDLYWTYVNGSVTSNYVRWTPAISGAGNFEVYVWVPRCFGTSVQAQYRVFHNGVSNYVTVNQNAYYDAWVSLGIHYFAAAGGEYVELTDATGESATSYRQLAFDAVNWTRR